MSLVIVEGPDGSGKSTLVERARKECKRYFWGIRPSRPPPNYDALYDAATWISRGAAHEVEIVCDRHPFVSEPIYGLVLRDKSLIPASARVGLLCNLIKETDRFIYCRPPTKIIQENVKASFLDQLVGVPKHIDELINEYDRSMKEILRLGGKVIYYDYTYDRRHLYDLFFGDIPNELLR